MTRRSIVLPLGRYVLDPTLLFSSFDFDLVYFALSLTNETAPRF
jgi:hypothetical protein